MCVCTGSVHFIKIHIQSEQVSFDMIVVLVSILAGSEKMYQTKKTGSEKTLNNQRLELT